MNPPDKSSTNVSNQTPDEGANYSPENTSEIDENKLRGDSIGNTVYSERYVLQTLLKLKDNNWNRDIEDDMCCIWDMTLDKNVVDFLLSCNFIDLSLDIIKGSKEVRLIEILVGIISNLCMYETAVETTIHNHNFDVLLKLMYSDDPLILIQVMRLFKAIIYCENTDSISILSNNVLNQINFILSNGKNTELLSFTLQVLGEITAKNNNIFLKIDFLLSISEAFKEIINNVGQISIDEEIEKHLPPYLKCIESSCNLINQQNDNNIKEIIQQFNQESITQNVKIFEKYLQEYTTADFIFQSRNFEYFLYCSANFLVTFQTEPNTNIFNCYFTLYQKILNENVKQSFETDVCEYIYNYLSYFVQSKTMEQLKNILKCRTKDDIKKLFVDEIIQQYECPKIFKNIVNELCS